MKRVSSTISLLGASLALITSSSAAEEGKKTRDEMVMDDRSALEESAHWIYNDLKKAFAEAKASGRPLMVVHRCIP